MLIGRNRDIVNGEYYFTGIGAPNETWTATSGTDSILPNMAYEIRIDTTNQAQLDTLKLTTANATGNNGNDQNDSDATVSGNYAVIPFTTGLAGSTNHTFDFGFQPICSITAIFAQNACNNNGTTAITTDDYFSVTVSAVSATNGGAGGKYEVVLNGTVLNTGGTAYGASATVGTATTFKSDGATTYTLIVRDLDMPTCETSIYTTMTSAACSTIVCKPMICLPVTVMRAN